MTNIEVILNDPDLVVLGGPSSVALQVDVGATGQRGSLIYANAGLPSALTIPNYDSILPGDLYINIESGPNYSWVYQYLVKPGGNTWEAIVSLNPAIYNAIHDVAFVAGSATFSIPLTDITATTTGLTADNFAIDCAFENADPVVSSVSSKAVSAGNLVFTVTAASWNGSTWAAYVDATAVVAVSIKVVSSVHA